MDIERENLAFKNALFNRATDEDYEIIRAARERIENDTEHYWELKINGIAPNYVASLYDHKNGAVNVAKFIRKHSTLVSDTDTISVSKCGVVFWQG